MRLPSTSTRPRRPSFIKAICCSTRHAPGHTHTTRAASLSSKAIWTFWHSREAGFGETVAPLGTALTEDQLKLLWRFAPEPILCFDGDSAGRKAADRAIEIALPWLKPGQSVAFAFLPEGVDPDDLIRQQGASAVADVLAKTRPLVDVLWDREMRAGPFSTPEQRAALDARLLGLAMTIEDASVRGHYQRELRDRLYQLGRERGSSRGIPDAHRRGSGFPQASYTRP